MRTRSTSLALLVLAVSARASAQELRVHARGAVAHAVTEPQRSELGWGGGGALGAELGLGKHWGVQIMTSAMALAEGAPPKDATFAPRETGMMFGSSGGLRLSVAGLWVDGGGGVAVTGGKARPLVEAALGYDFRLTPGSALQLGPYVGYQQVIADPQALRPEDGRVVLFGLHFVLGATAKAPLPPPRFEAKRADPPKKEAPQPSDRDKDGVGDADDACPDVPGVATDDPSTNGCPETPLRMVEDRLELPDTIRFDFNSPRIKSSSMSLLRKIAEYINARGDVVRVDIEGHADEIGTVEYNLELSRARAEEVRRALEQSGTQAELVTRGFGKSRPRASGHDDRARSINRRVEFIVTRQRKIKEEEVPRASN